ncbi:MAG: hypothetical protein HC828_15215 [Blastochloris sp.]|nr:hypothetical protein [Blastochloris sp.]
MTWLLASVAVYRKALSADDVQQNFAAGADDFSRMLYLKIQSLRMWKKACTVSKGIDRTQRLMSKC